VTSRINGHRPRRTRKSRWTIGIEIAAILSASLYCGGDKIMPTKLRPSASKRERSANDHRARDRLGSQEYSRLQILRRVRGLRRTAKGILAARFERRRRTRGRYPLFWTFCAQIAREHLAGPAESRKTEIPQSSRICTVSRNAAIIGRI